MPIPPCANRNRLWLFPYCQQLLSKIYFTTITHAWRVLIFDSDGPRQPLRQSFKTPGWQQLASLILASMSSCRSHSNQPGEEKSLGGGSVGQTWRWLASHPSLHSLRQSSVTNHVPGDKGNGLGVQLVASGLLSSQVHPTPDWLFFHLYKEFSDSFSVGAPISSWSSLQVHWYV